MTTATFSDAFKAARAARKERTTTPLLVTIATFLGRHVPSWKRVRTTALTVSGFGFLDIAAWQLHTVAGLAAVGISLLILEALGGSDQ